MASAFRQPLLTVSSKLLQFSKQSAINSALKALTAQPIATRGLTLSRSVWCLASQTERSSSLAHRNLHNKLCSCRSLHTEGDEKLASFLDKEIKDEQKSEQPVTSIPGWDIKTDGTGVILTKTFKDEVIKVEFDVNDSVDSQEHIYDGTEPSAPPDLVSKPPFEVEIKKKSGRKVRFFCEFSVPEPQFVESDGTAPQDSVEDQFSIVEVRLDEDSKSGQLDKSYTHSAAVMDGTLYDMLMDMLDERGIDDEFINNMVGYATSYEYKLYLNFLQNLKSIVTEK